MKNKIYYLLLTLFLLSACGKDYQQQFGSPTEQPQEVAEAQQFTFKTRDTTNVSISQATQVAEHFFNQQAIFSNNERGINYTIDEKITVPDENNEPAMYIVKLKPRGFVIVSATTKETPILGHSEEGVFDVDNVSPGILDWFYEKIFRIQTLRGMPNYNIPEEVTTVWLAFKNVNNQRAKKTDRGDILSVEQAELYGPLLETSWGQGTPYNQFAPKLNCSGYVNGPAPAGCVATAVAQVLKYHAYPNNKYNWKIMPKKLARKDSITKQGIEVARLLKDVGGYLKTKYGCEGSSSSTSYAPNVFKTKFNYKSGGTFAKLSLKKAEPLVKADIKAKRPVIMRGDRTKYTYYTKKGFWPFKKKIKHIGYKDGHAWVCDGYEKSKFSVLTDKEHTEHPEQVYYVHFYHMNWGWGEQGGNNGWFHFNKIETKSGKNYQYERYYLTGITPK